MSILGQDSSTAAAGRAAAASSNRIWQFMDLFYLNQGQESSGYVTDDFLRSIARGAGVTRQRGGGRLEDARVDPAAPPVGHRGPARRHQQHALVPARARGQTSRLRGSSFEPAEFTAALDEPWRSERDRLRLAARLAAGLGLASGPTSPTSTTRASSRSAPRRAGASGCRARATRSSRGCPVALMGSSGTPRSSRPRSCPASSRGSRQLAGLVGLRFSLYLTYLELFEIDAICQWCVGSAVIMAVLAVLTVLRALRQGEPLPG